MTDIFTSEQRKELSHLLLQIESDESYKEYGYGNMADYVSSLAVRYSEKNDVSTWATFQEIKQIMIDYGSTDQVAKN